MARPRSPAAARRALIGLLSERGAIRSREVRAAFEAVPRELFVPEVAREHGAAAVYRDDAFLVKRDAQGAPTSSSSQPTIMAEMLEHLGVHPGHRVLEIGAGTGYNAALLSLLAGQDGEVVSVDVDPDMTKRARAALRTGGYVARVVTGDGRNGVASRAPYDRIIVTASTTQVFRSWRDQLVEGGLLVVPFRLSETSFQPQRLVVFRREGRRLESLALIMGGFMGLRTSADEPAPLGATVSFSDVAADERFGFGLSGAILGALDREGRAKLVARIAGPRRETALGFRFRPLEAALFIAIAAPDDSCELSRQDQQTVWGVANAGGFSGVRAATGRARRPRSSPTVAPWMQLWSAVQESYGTTGAERMLTRVLEEWRSLGRPGDDRLRITVCFDDDTPDGAWRAHRRGDSTVAYTWEPRRGSRRR